MKATHCFKISTYRLIKMAEMQNINFKNYFLENKMEKFPTLLNF